MNAAPPRLTVTIDRFPEPYTGLPLLGVGGIGPVAPADFAVEVRYDGRTAIRTPSEILRTPDGDRLHFATQLPLEPDVRRVTVVAVGPRGEAVMAEQVLTETTAERPTPEPLVPERGLKAKVKGVVRRGVRSVVTGEVFALWRWKARAGRLAAGFARARRQVEHKLVARRFRPRAPHDAYVENTALTPRLRAAMADEAPRFRLKPTVSILTPVYNVDPKWLAEAIASVQAQVYPHWELCLADDASTRPDLVKFLAKLPADPRIKLVRRPTNGHICAATNTAADAATGEFVALMDNDDALAPDALFHVVRLLQDHPDADLIYSDEDKVTEAGHRYDPQFKPDWSPDLLWSYNYVNHFTVLRRSVFERAGRFREGYEGSQDHDLLLRVTELTDRVYHVPRILYHWRAVSESTAGSAGVKPYVHTSGRRAVEDALARRKIDASLFVPPFAQKHGLPVLGFDGPDDGPAVAVVIRGDAPAAGKTVRAVKQCTEYRNYTVYLAVDGAAPAEALNRLAAGRSEPYILFLEAGVEPADSRWLSRLVAHLKMPGVGAVGGLIRDENGTVLRAGTLLGMRDGIAPGDACRGVAKDGISYYFYAEVGRTVSAPGRGCLLTRRDAFDRAGGFDADRFGRTLYDVDYCLRLAGLGLRAVHVGGAELVASGPAAADRTDDPLELRAFKLAHGRPADPYYNPNLSDRDSFRQNCDAQLSQPAEARIPAAGLVVAAHNLNTPEGAPRYLSEIVLGLTARGRVAPAVFSPLGGAGEAVYADDGVSVVVADAPWSRRFVDGKWTPQEYAAAQKRLSRLLRGRRPDVVLANTLLTFPVVEAAARLGIPAVWVIHESYDADVLARVFPPFARARIQAAFAMAARVVPASHDTAALFAHWNTRGNVRVLHNGLDARPFDEYARTVSKAEAAARVPGLPGKKKVIAVGTVCERKGQHTLVEAAAILARTRSDFECHLVGARDAVPYTRYVRDLVSRRGLDGVVHLIPETDDVWRFYRAADVFACTSYVETFSRAVMEAEAFGLPIVSTACCGLSEQVFWDFNALRFDFGDAAGLAAHLDRVLGDDGLRADMARRSRAAFDAHLDYGEMLDRYEAVVLAAARTGPRGRTRWVPQPTPARPPAPPQPSYRAAG